MSEIYHSEPSIADMGNVNNLNNHSYYVVTLHTAITVWKWLEIVRNNQPGGCFLNSTCFIININIIIVIDPFPTGCLIVWVVLFPARPP